MRLNLFPPSSNPPGDRATKIKFFGRSWLTRPRKRKSCHGQPENPVVCARRSRGFRRRRAPPTSCRRRRRCRPKDRRSRSSAPAGTCGATSATSITPKPREALGYSAGLPFDSIKLENTWSGGGGIGYAFNGWFRADLTADYRSEARIAALSSGSSYVHGYSTDTLKLETTTVLLNGYFDLGNWSGITPYVGAGIGFANNDLSSYSSKVSCLTVTCSSAFSQAAVAHERGTKTNLAWALMAGAAVDIGDGLKLDLGYRYLRVGENKTESGQRRLRLQAEAARRPRGPDRRPLHDRLIGKARIESERRAVARRCRVWVRHHSAGCGACASFASSRARIRSRSSAV